MSRCNAPLSFDASRRPVPGVHARDPAALAALRRRKVGGRRSDECHQFSVSLCASASPIETQGWVRRWRALLRAMWRAPCARLGYVLDFADTAPSSDELRRGRRLSAEKNVVRAAVHAGSDMAMPWPGPGPLRSRQAQRSPRHGRCTGVFRHNAHLGVRERHLTPSRPPSRRALALLPACLHACMPACLHACMHACMPACMPACLPACLHACMPACLHACMPACLHACMPACLHACMPACLHACMPACLHACAPWTPLARVDAGSKAAVPAAHA